MKYAYPQLSHKSRFLTFGLVKNILQATGHEVVQDITDDVDAVLFSACDVMDMRKLRQVRQSTDRTVIVGGHYGMNFWSAIQYADIVWLGEIFDFAGMNNIADISNSASSYAGSEKWDDLVVSSRIDWDLVPVIQENKNRAYYWGGSGCQNNCKFCYTSWTHDHQVNTADRIQTAKAVARDNKVYLMVVANEYDYDPETQTKDMLLRTYLKTPVRAGWVRIGVEFPTEQTRKKMGKPFTRDELFAAFQKAAVEKVNLRLFHIGGYNPIEEWDQYISEVTEMSSRAGYESFLNLNFTNLQYQNYTPLYRERRSVDPAKYLTGDDVKRWYDQIRQYTPHVFIGRPSPFGHVAWRMGVELSRTQEQMKFWMPKYNRRNKFPPDEMLDWLSDTGVFDTPRVSLKRRSGKIKVIGGAGP